MRCLHCDYALTDVRDQRCPECGRQFDRAKPATFRAGPTGRIIRWRVAVPIGILVALIVALMVWALRAGLAEGGSLMDL